MPQYRLWDPLHQLNWGVHRMLVTAVNVLCYQTVVPLVFSSDIQASYLRL